MTRVSAKGGGAKRRAVSATLPELRMGMPRLCHTHVGGLLARAFTSSSCRDVQGRALATDSVHRQRFQDARAPPSLAVGTMRLIAAVRLKVDLGIQPQGRSGRRRVRTGIRADSTWQRALELVVEETVPELRGRWGARKLEAGATSAS